MKYSSLPRRLTTILFVIVSGVFASHQVHAATYTFVGSSATSTWTTPTNFSPNGTPGAGDTVVVSAATGGLGVSGATQTVLNFDGSNVTSSQSVIGANGAAGASLFITGTLTKGGSANLTFRNSGIATAPLSLTVNQIDLGGTGNLALGSSSSNPLTAFTATTVNITNSSALMLLATVDGGTFTVQNLNITAGSMVLRNITSGSSTLVVNSLTGNGGSVKGSNSAVGSTTFLNLDVSGSSAYSGTLLDGVVGSVLNVTKNGSGTQDLNSVSSTYTGVTTINGGVLGALRLAVGGSNSSIGAAGTAASNLIINGGTLRYLGGGASTDRNFTLGVNGGGLDSAGAGSLTFSSTAAIALAGSNASRTLTLSGSNNGTLAGSLGDNGTGKTSLVKTGTGRWTLSGSNTYTGTTTVSQGTLLLAATANNIASSAAIQISSGATLDVSNVSGGFTLASGQMLSGVGTVLGSISTGGGSVLSPGNSPGTLNISGNLNLGNGTSMTFDAGDLIAVSGSLTLGTGFSLSATSDLAVGNYDLFTYTGSLINVGNLSTWTASGLTNGYSFLSDGDSVYLSVVPEPGTYALVSIGLAGLLWRARRKVRSNS